MNLWGALVGGMLGTLVLTTALSGASELSLTRIDIPFLLGTAFSQDRRRAKVIGYGLHFVFGVVFALGYYAVFVVIGDANWWLGMLFGFFHALFAGTALVNVLLPLVHPRMGTPFSDASTAPLLEAPGFMLLNYGRATPVVTIVAHIAYGAIVAETIRLSS
jgi:hypothetical protein